MTHDSIPPLLSLVIPCYNELDNLQLLFDRCAAVVDRDDVEIVFVDNGSTDASPGRIAELLPHYAFARSIRVEVNQGYGYGILAGLQASEGKFLAWTHADMQTDPGDAITGLSILLDALDPEQVFVKGRRYGRPIADVFFTVGMAICETVITGQRMWDINAQPTMFTRDFFKAWESPPHDFSLDLYAYYQARKMGLAVKRFPVRFGERAHGSSHWNVDWRSKAKFIKRTMDFTIKLRREL